MTGSDRPIIRRGSARIAVPFLTGMTGSGLLLVAADISNQVNPIVGSIPILAGAIAVGVLIDNPGNEGLLLVGAAIPIAAGALVGGGLESPTFGLAIVALLAGFGLLFIALLVGIMVGRRWDGPILPDATASALLALTGTASLAAWLVASGIAFGVA